jgi:hypothetical protein
MVRREWMCRANHSGPPTHLLLDGGKLSVPDDQAGAFLNVYFNHILKGEKLSVVEIKTPVFKFFIDLDIKLPVDEIIDAPKMFRVIRESAADFWEVDDLPKMIVASAEAKMVDDLLKTGYHVHFPDIFCNAPIAGKFREHLLANLGIAFEDASYKWSDIVDEAVYKGSGLRLMYASKGRGEDRAYSPLEADTVSARDRRVLVHEASIRAPAGVLSRCRGGEDQIADQPDSMGRVVVGRSVALAAYEDVLPHVQAVLPEVYKDQRFTGCFKADACVYLKSNSRYCHNVGREHATSTVYFQVSRIGVQQRCFCRKDDRGCATYGSVPYPLSTNHITEFAPLAFIEDPPDPPTEFVVPAMPSKQRTKSLDALLKRSRFLACPKKKPPRKKTK